MSGTIRYFEVQKMEMMCRLMEVCAGMKLPAGCTPEQALMAVDQETLDFLSKQSDAANRYFAECLRTAQVPS